MEKKKMSLSQIVCLCLLWLLVCFYILIKSAHIDGPIIVSLLLSGAFVFIPLWKYLKRKD